VTTGIEILPPSSTKWEIAEDLVSAERRPLDASIIRKLWSPWECPEEFLPYLAWGLGLEIWKDEWPLWKKREIIAKIWQLKRLKTTPEGIRQYTNLVDSEPVEFKRPKHKMWWVPSMTDAERHALMAKMPEIRLYHQINTPLGWRATYVKDGIETEVMLTGFQNAVSPTYVVSIIGRDNTRAFYNRAFFNNSPPNWLCPSDAKSHVVTIQPSDHDLEFALPASLSPIRVRPEYKAEKRTAPVYKAWHYPSFKNFSFFVPSDAREAVYMSFRFIDEEAIKGGFGQPMSFWKWSRSGVPLFTAYVATRIPTKVSPWAFRQWWGVGYWMESDVHRLWETLDAIKVSQAARDDIWVSLGRYEPLLFSESLWFEPENDPDYFTFGDYRETWW
jgi:phage tail P2-like protein